MKAKFATALLVLGLVLSAPLAAATTWQGSEREIDGVLHVTNPADPPGEARTIAAQELWRVGGESEDDEDFLGQITDVLTDEDGRAYLLDSAFNMVRVYDRRGAPQGTLGREGEGPGEWRHARNMIFMPGGNLGIVRMMPSKIVLLDRAGRPAGDFAVPGASEMALGVIRKVEANRDFLVLSTLTPNLRDGGVVTVEALGRYTAEGGLLGTYIEESSRSESGRIEVRVDNAENFSTYWSLSPSGRLFVSPAYDEYRIQVYRADGTPERVIERNYRSLKRSAEEMQDLRDAQEQFFNMTGGRGGEINPYGRDIRQLWARDGGQLWVLSSEGVRAATPGSIGVLEVFDPAGRFQYRLSITADYDPTRDNFVLTGDRLYVLKEAQNAPSSTATSGSGNAQMIMAIGGRSTDDGGEAAPYAVICYDLPARI